VTIGSERLGGELQSAGCLGTVVGIETRRAWGAAAFRLFHVCDMSRAAVLVLRRELRELPPPPSFVGQRALSRPARRSPRPHLRAVSW
jgi:hypothetical protein